MTSTKARATNSCNVLQYGLVIRGYLSYRALMLSKTIGALPVAVAIGFASDKQSIQLARQPILESSYT